MSKYLTSFGAGFAAGEEFVRSGKSVTLPRYIKGFAKQQEFWQGYNAAVTLPKFLKEYDRKTAYEA